jgi:hypothetical protein
MRIKGFPDTRERFVMGSSGPPHYTIDPADWQLDTGSSFRRSSKEPQTVPAQCARLAHGGIVPFFVSTGVREIPRSTYTPLT